MYKFILELANSYVFLTYKEINNYARLEDFQDVQTVCWFLLKVVNRGNTRGKGHGTAVRLCCLSSYARTKELEMRGVI